MERCEQSFFILNDEYFAAGDTSDFGDARESCLGRNAILDHPPGYLVSQIWSTTSWARGALIDRLPNRRRAVQALTYNLCWSFSFPSYPLTPSTDKWVTQAQRWRARRKRGVSARKPVRCSWKAYICVVRILIIVTEVGICQHCQQPLEPSEGGRAWRFCHEADIEAYRPFPKLFEERRFCRQVVSVSISSTL